MNARDLPSGTLLYIENEDYEGSHLCVFLGRNADLHGISLVFWLDHKVGQCQVFDEDIAKKFIPVEIEKLEDGDSEEPVSMSVEALTFSDIPTRVPKNRVWLMIGKDRITLKKKE